jgi:cyclopropane-fatty-acyl-phospholipid synthase
MGSTHIFPAHGGLADAATGAAAPPNAAGRTPVPWFASWRPRLESVLGCADIRIGGDRPWDIVIHDPRVYRRVGLAGSLGAGEAYVDGWWDCPALDQMFARLLRAGIDNHLVRLPHLLGKLRAHLFNLQKPVRAFQIGKRHYDRGNLLFSRMLDRRMNYSCAYWHDGAHDLDEAQEAKLDMICRKLELRPGMRVLDIGCGWGSAVRFAAERYGVEAVGITVSRRQAEWARSAAAHLPNVEIRLQDYRDLGERFDRVLSIGMFEHVGVKNYHGYFDVVRRCLAPDGRFLLQTIGKDRSDAWIDPWIARYIFPNSELPSARGVADAAEDHFVLESWLNLGTDYDRTLMVWFRNFEKGWSDLRELYDERFYRMWTYYLLSCAGAFRARRLHVWQIVFSPAP